MQIIDVRTSGEFQSGHAAGSRSGMATQWLRSLSFEATNAGPWQAVRI